MSFNETVTYRHSMREIVRLLYYVYTYHICIKYVKQIYLYIFFFNLMIKIMCYFFVKVIYIISYYRFLHTLQPYHIILGNNLHCSITTIQYRMSFKSITLLFF